MIWITVLLGLILSAVTIALAKEYGKWRSSPTCACNGALWYRYLAFVLPEMIVMRANHHVSSG